MLDSVPIQVTLDDWIAREAISFCVDSPSTVDAAVDEMIASLDDSVELLGFGEALHGGEEILMLRNRLFQRLVTEHGYSAIAIESSLPKSSAVNEYISGRGPSSYDAVRETGFGHGFGRLEANRELVEWMRQYNTTRSPAVNLQFYGFDIPTGTTGIDSPRQVLEVAVNYLGRMDRASGHAHFRRIEPFLGRDFDWENPAVYADPAKSMGLSPAATELRVATEDLITELRIRQPELTTNGDASQYWEARRYAALARQLLSYHAAVARNAGFAGLLGIRDVIMADNLAHIVLRERGRGKVLAFAHNAHLQCGKVTVWPSWQKALGTEVFTWWPAGTHLKQRFGSRYAVIGSAVGVSEANGISAPEVNSLEARLTALPGSARFIATHKGRHLSSEEFAAVPIRSGSTKNLTYVTLGPQSLSDFDWWAVFDTASYNRGGPGLPG